MIRQIKHIRFLLKYPVYKIFKNRNKYLSNQNFLIIASVFVAIISSLAAILLKWAIHFIESLLINTSTLELRLQNMLFPIAGIVLSLVFIRYVFRLKVFEKGLSSIIYKINYNRSNIEKHHTYAHLVSSAFTVSLGGSVGVEAPIAITGSAIGSNMAKRLFVSQNEKTLLLACGAAAGISAIFNSPIAAVIFAFEVLLNRVSVPAFIPLLIASATAAVISNLFYSGQLILFVPVTWQMTSIPFYVLLAVICGLLSAYTIRVVYSIETRFNNKNQRFGRAIVQGSIVGALILFSPLLYGEGYFVINQILAGKFDGFMQSIALQSSFGYDTVFLFFVLATLLLKPVAAAFTVSAGGNGGIFAPSLFIGALMGLFFSRSINLTGLASLNELNFVVAGMAGVLSGVLSAPLTAIFMIAEVAGGYTLFVPLMIVSAGSYFITRLIEPDSIYTKKLANQGLLNESPDATILKEFTIRAILETDFKTFYADDSLRHITQTITETKRTVFPVLKRNGNLIGILTLGDLKQVLFKPELYDRVKVKDLFLPNMLSVDIEYTLDKLLIFFEEHPDLYYVPVQKGEKYAGFVSRSAFLNKYKSLMHDWVQQQAAEN
ncbi:MAG: chloride channel protein [Bacteroidia bacterium]|nr:chloride channel protein [Bacteroidia bacterium]